MKEETLQQILQKYKDYYEKLCTNKLYNIEEGNEFLETYNLSRPNHEETENLNRPITSKEIESVIKNLPKAKPRTRWLHW